MFKPGITAKLFLAILATSVLVAVAMGVAARVTFNRGFLGYLNEQGQVRMDTLLPSLAKAYQEQGGWQCLRENQRLWFRLLRPQPVAAGDERKVPPVKSGCLETNQPRPAEAVPSRDFAQELPEPDLTGVNLRLALLDGQRQRVAGYAHVGDDALFKPVLVDGGIVGWLALVPFQNVSTAAAGRFADQQLQANWVIGALAVLLAAAVAMLLARGFLAPLKRIARGTRALAAGHFDSRVQAHSGDELGQLAEDFNALARTLKANEQMRRNFMADVSHELRTPLSVLRGELEAIEDGVRALTPEAIRSLQGETAILSKLVSDLYDLSLADVGALSYRMAEVDLAEVLRTALHAYRERLAARGLRLELDLPTGPLTVLGDESRLQQLFTNLLENSLRYTDAGGLLRVSGQQTAAGVQIEFEDSAPGVAPELLGKLFDRFYRVEGSRNRATGGAGLGLAICKSIVEAHRGRMSAAAASLGGLKLSLVFPRVAGASP